MLKKINLEQKMTNRNLQRILNVILMMFFAAENREAEKDNDEGRKKISRLGMILVTVAQFVLLTEDIVDIIKKKAAVKAHI